MDIHPKMMVWKSIPFQTVLYQNLTEGEDVALGILKLNGRGR